MIEQAASLPPTTLPIPHRPTPNSTRFLGWLGGGLLTLVFGAAIFAPWLTEYAPQALVALPLEAPSATHILGTDDLGHDIFSQLVYGARLSLAIGLTAALFACGMGLLVALIAGYFRGVVEIVLMRFVDIVLAFPFLPLVIVLAAFLGRDLLLTVVVIAAVIWARPALLLRAQVIKVREFQHVTAAQAMGAAPGYILGRHLLPRLAPLLVAQFVRVANVAVFLEAAMAFLGLGDPNRVSWGTMLFFANASSAFLTDAWLWWVLPVGLALTLTIVGFAFLGYAVETWADPRLQANVAPTRTETLPPNSAIKSPSEQAVLEIQNLAVGYRTAEGVIRAVDGVEFTVAPQRIVGLVGESGCGKSTLSGALLRLTRPPGQWLAGTIYLNKQNIATLSEQQMTNLRGRQVALIPQNAMNALNPTYTIHRQVAEVARLEQSEADASRQASKVLSWVGLSEVRHDAYPHELSGGMRQRVVIAMAVVNKPALLIADEPVTGLDVVTQAQILQLLLRLREKFGTAILLISHNLPLIGQVADDLLVMYAGRIVEAGLAETLLDAPRHPYTQALLRAFPDVRGEKQTLTAIEGEPPDLLDLGAGCRFQPRCAAAFADCQNEDPPLFEPEVGRQVACLLERAA